MNLTDKKGTIHTAETWNERKNSVESSMGTMRNRGMLLKKIKRMMYKCFYFELNAILYYSF